MGSLVETEEERESNPSNSQFSVVVVFQAVGETSHGEKERMQFSISVKEPMSRWWLGPTYRSCFLKSPSIGNGKERR